jgi:hypothetical protein
VNLPDCRTVLQVRSFIVLRMRFGLVVLASFPLWSQSLQVSPSAAARGEAGSFLIKLESPKGRELVALQWEVAAPLEIVIDPGSIVAGSAAEAAQKSINCASVGKQDRGGSRYACILAGGKKTIGNGPVAVVRYSIRKGVSAGTVVVRIEKAIGVTGDLTKVDIGNVEGMVTIR